MISLVFQLTGGLLLAAVFATYPYPFLPVVGQKPHALQLFLYGQIRALFGVTFLCVGYILPYLGMEYTPEDMLNKIVSAIFGFGVLGFISFIFSDWLSERLVQKARTYDPMNPPTYNIFHILRGK